MPSGVHEPTWLSELGEGLRTKEARDTSMFLAPHVARVAVVGGGEDHVGLQGGFLGAQMLSGTQSCSPLSHTVFYGMACAPAPGFSRLEH